MKCPKCGADIPEGKFYCEKCGEALQIVPDYNPAEDITIGEEDNNIQNKDSSDASSGEQRSDRKQRFFYLLKNMVHLHWFFPLQESLLTGPLISLHSIRMQ